MTGGNRYSPSNYSGAIRTGEFAVLHAWRDNPATRRAERDATVAAAVLARARMGLFFRTVTRKGGMW